MSDKTSSLRSTAETWGSLTRALHWISAVMVIGLLTHGWLMTHVVARENRQWNYATHGSIAIYFAVVLLLRLVWRVGDSTPRPPSGMPTWQIALSHATHAILYILMIAMVVTGYLMWSSLPARIDPARAALWDFHLLGFKLPAAYAVPARDVSKYWEHWHEFTSHLLEIFVVLHIAAALWHQFVTRDNVMARMVRGV